MGKITDRLKELAFTNGTLENLVQNVDGCIRHASHSLLGENDQKVFMRQVLALIETTNEEKEKALETTKEFWPSYRLYSGTSLESLLDVIQKYIKGAKESSFNNEQRDELPDYIMSAVVNTIDMTKEEMEEILMKFCPESVREELAAV